MYINNLYFTAHFFLCLIRIGITTSLTSHQKGIIGRITSYFIEIHITLMIRIFQETCFFFFPTLPRTTPPTTLSSATPNVASNT
jgi:hypothetical protein